MTLYAYYVWQGNLLIYIENYKQNFYFGMVIATVAPALIAPSITWPIINLILKIDKLETEMRQLATYDSLTGLLSRRAFFHDANMMLNFSKREQMPVALLIIDLDKFKAINDTYGHSAGDKVLINFGEIIQSVTRKSDISGRIGGEEFVILLPDTSLENAKVFSSKLHSTLKRTTVLHDQSPIKYTISAGLCSLIPKDPDSMESILQAVDKGLYLAKSKGRDQTVSVSFNGGV